MSGFSIGDVEAITGLKAHILRYWEEVIPAIAPKKNVGGHRLYSQREIDVIRRLKYLIYTDGFTIDAAWKKIVRESECYSKTEVLMAIRKCRTELNSAYVTLKNLRRKTAARLGNQESKDIK